MPTFCALADYAPSQDLMWDGTDIWPLLTRPAGQKATAPRALYWAGPGFRARAIRDGDWKWIVRGTGDSATPELFDLAHDPHETTNLAAEMPGRVASLRSKLNDLAAADGDAAVRD